MEAALKAIEILKSRYNISPNAFTYNLFINAYGTEKTDFHNLTLPA